MGPPKAKPKRISYGEQLKRFDHFEYRYNRESKSYFMFNPYTGETIFGTDNNYMDRKKSCWAPIDLNPSECTITTILYPETYASRCSGRRIYHNFSKNCMCMTKEQQKVVAATHIAAVCRGWIARQRLKEYMKRRYNKRLCQFSGYYYYYDSYNTDNNVETSWYKPVLAFPNDIEAYKPEDPDDYLHGDKYTLMGFEHGPYAKRQGVKKTGMVRSKHIAFLKPNAWRDSALNHPAQINLEKSTLGSIIAYMDELNVIDYKINEYSLIRSAICGNDWGKVLYYMHKHSDKVLLQVYGLLAFSKSVVPLEKDGILTNEAQEVFDLCLYLIDDPDRTTSPTHKVFALMAIHNLLALRAGRMEFFNTDKVLVTGAKRQDAVDEFLAVRIKLFIRLIDGVEMETSSFSTLEQGKKVVYTTTAPTRRGADIAEYGMLCLSVLSQNPEQRELMSSTCVGSIIRCVMKCNEECGIAAYALQALYNFCYRCEAGQLEVIDTDGMTENMITLVKRNFQGDHNCMLNLRRLELAIKPDGWRGNVEVIVEKEMKKLQEKTDSNKYKIQTIHFSEAAADSKENDIKILEDKLEQVKISAGQDDYKAEEKQHKHGDDDSKSEAKSLQYVAKHEVKNAARDMKFDDDDLSVSSDITV